MTVNPSDEEIIARLRDIVDNSPYAHNQAAGHVPCLFTMSLDGQRVEWCRIDAGSPHRIHVSWAGYYRWDDNGILLETPHWASDDFCRLYADDPTGQTLYRPGDGPSSPATAPAATGRPPEHLIGFERFLWRWRAYNSLPTLQRRLRRLSLLTGFVVGLIVTVAIIAACVISVLVLAWLCVGWFAEWLTT